MISEAQETQVRFSIVSYETRMREDSPTPIYYTAILINVANFCRNDELSSSLIRLDIIYNSVF